MKVFLLKNFRKFAIIKICLIALILPLKLKAQILTWDFQGATTTGSVSASTSNLNLNTSSISRGQGIAATGLADAYSSSAFTTSTTLADAVTQNDYLQFTISPKTNYKVSLSSLESNFRRSGQGPTKFQWQYSLDGFQTAGVNIGSEISFTSTATEGTAMPSIPLSGISALQSVTSPAAITIRLYGYAASDAAGTFALGRPTTPATDLAINGTVSATVLPVNLLSFEVKASGNSVVLNWLTASEDSNKLFTVERSEDNSSFSAVTQITGAGSISSKKAYSATDYSVFENKEYYYRLKQTNFNGDVTYSDSKAVKISGSVTNVLTVYPNPTNTSITISYPENKNITISLSDLNGKVILAAKGTITDINQSINQLFSKLPASTYLLQLIDGEKIFSKKIVKY